jgi:type III restriction enzyme
MVGFKAQQQLAHPDVQRKRAAALAWCERVNALPAAMRSGLPWHYVLLGEDRVQEGLAQHERLADVLTAARLWPAPQAQHQTALW